jgi:hypothetical protein
MFLKRLLKIIYYWFSPRPNYLLNSYKVQEIYVLGNGVSLSNSFIYFKTIRSSTKFFVCNDFYQSSYFFSLQPEFYVLADPFYWNVKYELGGSPNGDIFEVFNRVTWKLKVFLPYQIYKKKYFDNLLDNGNIELCFWHDIEASFMLTPIKSYLYRNNYAAPINPNVMSRMIYISSFFTQNIHLFGADHNWANFLSLNKNNEVILFSNHFYSESSKKSELWLTWDGKRQTMLEALDSIKKMIDYGELSFYLFKRQVFVVNHNEFSHIGFFKKV